MRVAIIALMLVACVFGSNFRIQKVQMKAIQDLKQTRWGRTMLTMIQMHSNAQGAVDELVDAIEELIHDLTQAIEDLEFDFQKRTNEHNSEVIALEQNIRDAVTDVVRIEDTIANLLVPRLNQISKNIAQIEENVDHNRQNLAEETLLREQDHANYETLVTEYNEATAAVDEALALLNSLGNPSFIQVKKLKSTLGRISKKQWSKIKQGPMVQALVQLAMNQNFSDQGVLGEVVEALNEFRNDVVDALNQITLDEAQAVQDYEERVDQLDAEYTEFQRQIARATLDLTATQNKIEESNNFRNQREEDRKLNVAQLELEQETYAQETEIYTDLKNEYLRELAVSEQAFSLVESADFSNINTTQIRRISTIKMIIEQREPLQQEPLEETERPYEPSHQTLAAVDQVIEDITRTFSDYFDDLKVDSAAHLNPERLVFLHNSLQCLAFGTVWLHHINEIDKAIMNLFIAMLESLDSEVEHMPDQVSMIRQLIYYMDNLFGAIDLLMQMKVMENYRKGPIKLHVDYEGYRERFMGLAQNFYADSRLLGFATCFKEYVQQLRVNTLDAYQPKVQELGEVIKFYHVLGYASSYEILKTDLGRLRWRVRDKKDEKYIRFFETETLAIAKQFYSTEIPIKMSELRYPDLIAWIQRGIEFEEQIQRQALPFSRKEMEQTLKEILAQHIEPLLTHEQGPMHMFKEGALDQVECLLRVISLDIDNIVKLASVFQGFLQERGIDLINALDVETIDLPVSKAIFERVDSVLTLATQICYRFTEGDFQVFNRGVCRTQFLNAKNRAFHHILRSKPIVIEAIHLLVDNHIRTGAEGTDQMCDKLGYFLSVFGNTEQFFKRYGQLMSYRLLDNFKKFQETETQIIKSLQKWVLNEHIAEIQKIIEDVSVSLLVSEGLNQHHEFQALVKPHIKEVNLLIISESQINTRINPNCSWWIPQRTLEEMVQLNQPGLKEQEQLTKQRIDQPPIEIEEQPLPVEKKVKKVKVARKSRVKKPVQMEVEDQPQIEEEAAVVVALEEPSMLSKHAPQCLKQIFQIASMVLHSYQDQRVLKSPLLSLGSAEVQFRCLSGVYYVQMSTAQMVIVLAIDESPVKSVARHHLSQILYRYEEDVNALVHAGILIADDDSFTVNENYHSPTAKVKVRPKAAAQLHAADRWQLKVQQNRRDELFIEALIVKCMKKEKTMLIHQLIEYIDLQAQVQKVPNRKIVNLIVQKMLTQKRYIVQDEKNALIARYKDN